jgi:hypothetical protein
VALFIFTVIIKDEDKPWMVDLLATQLKDFKGIETLWSLHHS